MITVNLRDNNSIINLNCDGKIAIRGKTLFNQYFHTPIDLLLSSIGLCIGGELINYCRVNDLNVQLFESISIDYLNESFILNISCPEDFDKNHINYLTRILSNCTISKELKKEINITWNKNILKSEELIRTKRSCCGS